jgi:flagellar hook-length control protein FliK
MTVQPTLLAPAQSSAPPPSGKAPPGAPPGTPPFDSALAEHWARTANAEGHEQKSSDVGARTHGRHPGGSDAAATSAQLAGLAMGASATRVPATGAPSKSAVASSAISKAVSVSAASIHGALTAPSSRTVGGSTGSGAIAGQPSVNAADAGVTPGAVAGSKATAVEHASAASVAAALRSAGDSPRATADAGSNTAAQETAKAQPPTQTSATVAAAAQPSVTASLSAAQMLTAQAQSAKAPTAAPASERGATGASTLGARAGDSTAAGVQASATPHFTQPGSVAEAGPEARGAAAEEAITTGAPTPSRTTHTSNTRSALSTIGAALSSSTEATAQTSIDHAVSGQTTALPTGSADGPVLAAGVQMQDMIDSIRATIQIAARAGIAQARIALQPEELGHISIHLSQTSEGLLARVTAATPAAAEALAASRPELHQMLNSLGVSLLRLDIGSFGQSEARNRDGQFAQSSQGAGSASHSTTSEDGDGAKTIRGVDGAAQPVGAPRGELLDVLA